MIDPKRDHVVSPLPAGDDTPVVSIQGLPDSPVLAINDQPAAWIEAPMTIGRADFAALIERMRQ